jgi:hypothetical protein
MPVTINGTTGIAGVDGSASTPAVQGTDTNTGIFFPAADTIAFGEGGAEAMRIDSSGNVGIGNSTARARLTVSDGTLNTAGEAVYQGYIVGADRSGLTEGNLAIQSNDAMAIDKGGSISFGGRAVSASDAGANWARIAGRKENGTTAEYGGYLQFATRPNSGAMLERGRFTSGGYFKASNNGTYSGSTAAYYEFVNTADGSNIEIRSTSATFASGGQMFVSADRNTTNNTFYYVACYNYGASAYKLRIADSGNVTNVNGSYGTISDFKLKQDITDATSQWNDIKNLRFRKYRLKSEVELDPNAKPFLGLVAQEAELVCPGLVEEHIDRDREDNDLGTTTKSIKTSILYMKAVKALQEAMERIETLEAQNAAFEARLAALENK